MKLAVPPWLNAVALVGIFVFWAVAAHLGSAGVGNVDLNAAVALAPLLVCLVLLLWPLKRPKLMLALVGVLMAVFWLCWQHLISHVAVLYYLQHLGTHLAMALFFGKTLAEHQVPLITQLAKRIEGDHLTSLKVTYTRWVTIAWTVFFCVNALVSTFLFVAAPLVVWSFHANLMTGPLIVLMFLGEYAVRVRLLPAHERPSLVDTVRAYRQKNHSAVVVNSVKPRA